MKDANLNEPITRDDLLDWGIPLTESMMTSDELAEQGDRQYDELRADEAQP